MYRFHFAAFRTAEFAVPAIGLDFAKLADPAAVVEEAFGYLAKRFSEVTGSPEDLREGSRGGGGRGEG